MEIGGDWGTNPAPVVPNWGGFLRRPFLNSTSDEPALSIESLFVHFLQVALAVGLRVLEVWKAMNSRSHGV